MLGKRLINTGGAGACTTDTVQILDAGSTQSLALYRFEDNANDTAYTAGTTVSSYKIIDLDVNGYSSGATISNSASNTDDATKYGTATYSNPSGSNGRFDLDGASDYLQIDASTTFNGATNYTLEGWFKPDNLTALDHFFAIHDGSSGSKFYVRVNDAQGDIDAMVYGSTGTGSTAAAVVTNNTAARLQANVFNHVVMTYTDGSGGLLSIYINGVLAGSAAASGNGNTTGTANFLIGALGGYVGAYDFDGEVGQVRFYISALSATEVLQNYNATRALYAAHDGTASNVTYTTGKFGKAAVFNGSNSKIDLPNNILPNNSTASSSCSFWFKSSSGNSAGDSETIIDAWSYSTSEPGWGLFMEPAYGGFPDGQLYLANYYLGGTSGGSGNVTFRDGNWHFGVVVLDFSGGTIKVYIDGNSTPVISQTVSSSNVDVFTTNAAIGYQNAHPSYPRYFNGAIDQVRIFDKALNSGEINSLYNETATSAASGTIDNPSTVAYYKMADASDETGSYNGTAYGIDFNVQGKYGFAGKFSGSSGSYIQTGYTALSGTSASISLWVNIDAYTSYGGFAIDSTGAGAAARFTLGQGSTAGKLWVSVGNGSTSWYDETTVSISSYGLGNWFHLVGTINGTTVKIYINGSLIHTFTSSVSYVGGGQHTYYLGGWGNSLLLNGKLDQIRFFNKEISLSEVTNFYNEIQCPNTITAPESYFNTVLYSGTNSNQSITGFGFKPDFVWIKRRNSSVSHINMDSIRGNYAVYSNLGNSQDDYSSAIDITSSTLGFDLIGSSSSLNASGGTYVSWAWKAASSNTTNNDGDIQSTVRASQESGFSIVKYNGATNATSDSSNNGGSGWNIGHGLGVPPALVIIKKTNNPGDWYVGSDALGSNPWTTGNGQELVLSGSYAMASPGGSTKIWNSAPTSTTFNVGGWDVVNRNGDSYIAYCFANIDGYQRIGSYVGNGSANGPFVYTGFEPAWILIKNISTTKNWYIQDNKRSPSNPRNKELYPNSSTAEYTMTAIDFYTNGFKIVTSDSGYNTNGHTYIFMAIAANPDTTAPTKANSFNTLLYTGNDSNNRSITGLGFKPDFLWIKRRASSSESHAIYDSVRGPNLQLSSDSTGAEATNSGSYLGMSSFDSDGFNVGNNGGTNRAHILM